MKIATKTDAGSSAIFTFANGEVVTCDVETLPHDMLIQLAVHGMKQKGGDSYAGADEKGLSVADCAAGVREIWAGLQKGVWSQAGGSGVNINAEALARVTGEDIADCVRIIAGMDKAAIKELVKRPDMKAAILAIKVERAAARADAAKGGDVDSSDLGALFKK